MGNHICYHRSDELWNIAGGPQKLFYLITVLLSLTQGWLTCVPREHFIWRISIFVTQARTKHRVKTKLHDKQTRRQLVKSSISLLGIVFSP